MPRSWIADLWNTLWGFWKHFWWGKETWKLEWIWVTVQLNQFISDSLTFTPLGPPLRGTSSMKLGCTKASYLELKIENSHEGFFVHFIWHMKQYILIDQWPKPLLCNLYVYYIYTGLHRLHVITLLYPILLKLYYVTIRISNQPGMLIKS